MGLIVIFYAFISKVLKFKTITKNICKHSEKGEL